MSNILLFAIFFAVYFTCKLYLETTEYTDYNIDIDDEKIDYITYSPKKFLSAYELDFYNKIISLEKFGYKIIPQINLATVIEKKDSRYKDDYINELFRNVDFGIFDQSFNLLLLIEINDKTHKEQRRYKRDLKVRELVNKCGYKLITFYTDYPNNKEYVINRIRKTIATSENYQIK